MVRGDYTMHFILRAAFATALFSLITGPATAGCEDILKYINYDTTHNYQSLTSDQINYASLCSSRYVNDSTARSAQIKAAYELASGSASATEDQIHAEQDNICHSNYGQSYLATLNVTSTEIVSKDATDTVKDCIIAEEHSFSLDGLASAGNAAGFSADVRWSGGGTIYLTNVRILPANAADCVVGYLGHKVAALPIQIASGLNANVSCTRKSTRKQISPDKTIDIMPSGLVSIVSSQKTINVPLVEIDNSLVPSSRLNTIDKTINVLTQKIIVLKNQNIALQASLAQYQHQLVTLGSTFSVTVDGSNPPTEAGQLHLVGGTGEQLMCTSGAAVVGLRRDPSQDSLVLVCGTAHLH